MKKKLATFTNFSDSRFYSVKITDFSTSVFLYFSKSNKKMCKTYRKSRMLLKSVNIDFSQYEKFID